jgi:hypothetical protein
MLICPYNTDWLTDSLSPWYGWYNVLEEPMVI